MSVLSNIPVFIPHVFVNIDEAYITKAFNKIGVINHMDFVSKQDGKGKIYNAVYIHFDHWLNNASAAKLHRSLENGDEARLVHDTPWFWVVLPNKGQKFVSTDRKPRIDLQFLGEKKEVKKEVKVASMPMPEPVHLNSLDKERTTYAQIIQTEKKVYPSPCERITRSTNVPIFEEGEDEDEFDAEDTEDVDNMAEMEAEMDADNADSCLISIDSRYIQTIEQENFFLRNQVNELRQALALQKYLASQGIY